MTIVQRMFDLMDEKQIKSSDLARCLGINKTVVSSWRSRQKNPPSEYLVQICVLLRVSLCLLVTGEESDNDLSEMEERLIDMYRGLDRRDQQDVWESTLMKLNRSKRGASQDTDSGVTA